MKSDPHNMIIIQDQKIRAACNELGRFSPHGKTVAKAIIGTSYKYWRDLSRDKGCL